VAYLRGQIDQVWPTLAPEDQAAAQSAFVTATRLERAFFDAALAGYPTP
jgi:thiaminase/transcriptional activator TenA